MRPPQAGAAGAGAVPLLALRGLQAGYGASRVLQGVDLQLQAGEVLALLGRNGSGRSTALKAVMGLLPCSGQVLWRGRDLAGRPPHEMARAGIGYVAESRDVFPALTVHQNLLLGERALSGRAANSWPLEAVYERFAPLRLRRNAPAGVLSGGEQQMLALARALVGHPALLLVDEPTEGLAPHFVEAVAACLRALRESGVAVLLVEHKLAIALALADRCAVLGHGRIVFEGTPAELQAHPDLQQQWLAV